MIKKQFHYYFFTAIIFFFFTPAMATPPYQKSVSNAIVDNLDVTQGNDERATITFPLLEGTNIDNQGNRTTVWFIITDISDKKLARSFKGMGLSYSGLLGQTPPAALSSATWTGNIINRYPRIPLVGGEWTFHGDLPNPIPSASNPTPFQDPNNGYSPLRSVTIGVPVVVNAIFVKWGDADFEQLRIDYSCNQLPDGPANSGCKYVGEVPGDPLLSGQVLEIDTEFPSPSVTFKLHKSWFMNDWTPYHIVTDAYPEVPANEMGVPFVPKDAKLGEMALPLYQSLSPSMNPNNLPGGGPLGGQTGVVPYFKPGEDYNPMLNIGYISWNVPQQEIIRFTQDAESLWLAGFINVYKYPPGYKVPFSPIDQSPSLVVNCPVPLTLDIDDFRDDFGHPVEEEGECRGYGATDTEIDESLPPNANLLNGGAIAIRDNQGNFMNEFCIGDDGDMETALAMLEVEVAGTKTCLACHDTVPLVFPRLFVSDLAPFDYQVAARLEAGSVYYIDSPHKITSLPAGMEGLTWIKTADRDKYETSQNFLYFSNNKALIVYVAYDSRASSLPNWLAPFTNTGTSIGTTDGSLNVYAKYFPLGPTGEILLGGNKALGASGDNSNYIVALRPIFGSEDSIEDFLKEADSIRLLPLFQWLKNNSQGFKKTIETMNIRLGKKLVHENLLIALIASRSDLNQVSIEPDPGTLVSLSAGTLVSLSEEDIVFTKGILQDIEKIVNPTSTDLSQK